MKSKMLLLYDYNIWANEKVIAHLKSFPDEVFLKEVDLGYKTIADVIGHIVSVDEIWLSRLQDESPSSIVSKHFASLEVASYYIRKIHSEIHNYIISVKDMDKTVTYSNTSGKKFKNTLPEILQHIVNHGTYHRGNITTMLRYQGYKGISTDYIAYLRSK